MRPYGWVVAVGLAGLLAWGVVSERRGGEPAPAPEAVPVTATPATRTDVPVSLQGIGTVQAYYSVTVHSRVDGQLDSVAFREGQEVHAGDRLAQIDPRPYQASLDQALAHKAQDLAQLVNSQRDLRRYTDLMANQAVPRQQVDTTRSQVAQFDAALKADDAAIEGAQVQLGYTTITSPIDGRVGIRQIDPGNIVHAADAGGIVVVTQVRPISVIFSLPEDELPAIAQAMERGPLEVTALSRDGRRRLDQGRLELIDNLIDQTTGTIRLKATMPNRQGSLWPGQYVNAELLVEVRRQVVTVPAIAVQRGEKGRFVYVVGRDHDVQVRPVTVGQFNQGVAVIDNGLAPGDLVVTTGQYRLKSGTKVTIATGAATGTASVARTGG